MSCYYCSRSLYEIRTYRYPTILAGESLRTTTLPVDIPRKSLACAAILAGSPFTYFLRLFAARKKEQNAYKIDTYHPPMAGPRNFRNEALPHIALVFWTQLLKGLIAYPVDNYNFTNMIYQLFIDYRSTSLHF